MSGQSEVKAILDSLITKLEAIKSRVPSLACYDLIEQSESGKEIYRLIGSVAEAATDAEIQLIDQLRSFGSEKPMSDTERRDYRLKRSEDILDLTDAAVERIKEYATGRAA